MTEHFKNQYLALLKDSNWERAKNYFQLGWLECIIRRQAKELGKNDAQIEEMLAEAERAAKAHAEKKYKG